MWSVVFRVLVMVWFAWLSVIGLAQAQGLPMSPVVGIPMGGALGGAGNLFNMELPSAGGGALRGVPAMPSSAPPVELGRPGMPSIRNAVPGSGGGNGTGGGAGAMGGAGEQSRIAARVIDSRSEFQDFIEKSIGRTLPIYGANLFTGSASTFAPGGDSPVTPDYIIGTGDEIVVRAWGAIDMDYRVSVDRAGLVSIPRVGSFQLSGVRYADLDKVIRREVGRVFRNFELSTSLGQIRAINVYIVGNALRPGAYTFSALSTLVNGVLAAGGPAPAGSLRRVELRRAGRVITQFDFYDLLMRGDKTKDLRLQSEDVIWIGPIGQQVAISGSVNQPGIFELKSGNTLGDLFAWAGGLATTALGERVTLERIHEREQRRVEELDTSALSQTRPLADGDLVTVYAIQRRFENAVSLRGNVARPMRFAFRPGMRVSDLIPNRQALITDQFYLGREQSILPNVIVNEADNTALVRDTDGRYQRTPIRSGARSTDSATGIDRQEIGDLQLRSEIRRTNREPNWEYAVIERVKSNDLTPDLIPFNLSRAVIDRDPQHDLALQPNDVVTIFSRDEMAVPRDKQTKFVRLEGEIVAAGVYRALPGETLRQIVARVGGLTSSAYLFGAEFSRDAVRRDQDAKYQESLRRMEQDFARASAAQSALSGEDAAIMKQQQDARAQLLSRLRAVKPTGRVVLSLDATQGSIKDLPDIELNDGDRFVVPPRPESVSVFGSVFNEGSFMYASNRRVKDYLGMAGGPTRTADRGSVFVIRADGSVQSSRQSTWLGSVEGNEALPGDTVFVPEDLERQPFMKSLRDWTMILYQFGLGAAAVKILR